MVRKITIKSLSYAHLMRFQDVGIKSLSKARLMRFHEVEGQIKPSKINLILNNFRNSLLTDNCITWWNTSRIWKFCSVVKWNQVLLLSASYIMTIQYILAILQGYAAEQQFIQPIEQLNPITDWQKRGLYRCSISMNIPQSEAYQGILRHCRLSENNASPLLAISLWCDKSFYRFSQCFLGYGYC